ncbi:hypothetical protein CCMSSC00406_0007981 [Pleurotus cornucopiae]|uniref:Uncharacterized protein n=1 Tax=Pleurotus cornucopiae TaxID=5321 RepID=A0ACB7ILH8_PLECO|nr:hypothetical protein CCMSSC00406_0007981 [Pleurotus cornucopiae]
MPAATPASDSEMIDAAAPPSGDVLSQASQADVVKLLTETNRQTFECLKVFCEKYQPYKEKSMFSSAASKAKRKAYKSVVKQALVYTSTISVSIRIAEKGMGISRDAVEALTLKDERTDWIVQPMLETTNQALADAQNILQSFRSIRVSLYETMKGISPGNTLIPPEGNTTGDEAPHCVTAQELRRMDENRLTDVTLAILDHFVVIVTEFVKWWTSLRVDVNRLKGTIEYYARHPEISERVRQQWIVMEGHYQAYHSEIARQQDYYDDVLKGTIPKTLTERVLGFIH